ncbi:MAG: hypothetical protein MUC97_01300 [Bernardetiaceae bacterium]|jgi:hypothetical protein|nr:hypothetical protein [Bernardetiaceae bacterium]
MKLKYTLLLVGLAATTWVSCNLGDSRNIQQNADWSKPEQAVAAANAYLQELFAKDSVHTRYDNVSKRIFALKKGEVIPNEVHAVAPRLGEVGVKMLADGNVPVIIDFVVGWDTTTYQVNGIDTVYGKFAVGGMSFRQIGDSVIYRWEKKGEFWQKQNAVVQ